MINFSFFSAVPDSNRFHLSPSNYKHWPLHVPGKTYGLHCLATKTSYTILDDSARVALLSNAIDTNILLHWCKTHHSWKKQDSVLLHHGAKQ